MKFQVKNSNRKTPLPKWPTSPSDNIFDWIKNAWVKLWVKFIIEYVMLFVLVAVVLVFKYLVPKKYRARNKTISDVITKITAMANNGAPKGDDSPITLFGKAVGLFETFWKNPSEDDYEFMRNYSDKNDLSFVYDYYFIRIFFPCIFPLAKEEKILEQIDKRKQLVEYVFDGGSIFIMKMLSGTRDYDEDDAAPNGSNGVSFYETFAYTKGFSYRKTMSKILESFNNSLYISRNIMFNNSQNFGITFSELKSSVSEGFYIEDEVIANLENEIKEFRTQRIARSYLLFGVPGCGKTSGCIEISKRLSNKTTKIDAQIFSLLDPILLKDMFENLGSDVYIVDDIDRITGVEMPRFLYALEIIKTFSNAPTLLATANYIQNLDKAVIRPGRFDELLPVPVPTDEQRFTFLKQLLEKYDIPLEDEEITNISNECRNFPQAYINEYCLQLKNNISVSELLKKIKNRKKYLLNDEDEAGEEVDD